MGKQKKKKKPVPLQNKQIAALGSYVFDNVQDLAGIEEGLADDPALDGLFVVFISICNGKSRALVVKGTGGTLRDAWKAAEQAANNLIKKDEIKVVWVKADIVNSAEEISLTDLNKAVINCEYKCFFRKGLAFDRDFETAFLESELSGNRMIDYYNEQDIADNKIDQDKPVLNLSRVNTYIKTYYASKEMAALPERIITFTTDGFFCDRDLEVLKLHNKGYDYGRRVTGLIDSAVVDPVMIAASEYLFSLIKPDGEFIYGYYPIFHKEIDNYNILRHAGSIWSLINLYRITRDEALIGKLNSAINYLIGGYLIHKSDDVAYIFEKKSNEVKLGGNGLTIIMLTEYMDVFETDEYTGLVRDLANGILEMEDPNAGKYYHVLSYPDFSRKEEFRTIYYDGEATFALTRAYTYTKDEKYLQGAKMAVENFIAEDYTKYRDHWVSYSMYEITKYVSDIRYFEFAMKNAGYNMDRIFDRARSAQTNLELLAITWQTYKRIKENNISSPYLDGFDVAAFAQTIYQRARHLLNGYFYPEFAMYMRYPNRVAGSFFVREDSFRIRIDDIQHYIGGYYYYSKCLASYCPFCRRISSPLTTGDFIQQLNK